MKAIEHNHADCSHASAESDLAEAAQTVTPEQFELAATMCHAMSDASRLRLLLWLSRREMCVSELVALDQAKLTSVSARLQMLHAARLVTRRREAKHIYYALADEHVRSLLANILNHASE